MTIDVKYELDNLRPNLFLQETEDSWEKIAKSLTSLIKLCDNGAYDTHPNDLVTMIKAAHRPIISAMNSERTRLCLIPMDLMVSLGTAMGMDFDNIMPLFIPSLLTNCARTNKVVINRAKSTLFSIIEVTQVATVLTHFLHNIKDKSSTMKLAIAEATLACLNSCNPPDLEKEARALEIEGVIRITARDANADVRKVSRKIFESYTILLPSRVQNFTAPMSPTTKKYLDIKPTTVSSQKLGSNIRSNANPDPKEEVRSKPSAGPSSSNTGHSRTASSTFSTATTGSHVRNPSTTLTRVSRKEPTPVAAPVPYVPVRPIQPSRVASETTRTAPHRSTTVPPARTTAIAPPTRTTAGQETKRPLPPLRTQRSAASLTSAATSCAPRRIQITTATTSAGASSSQALPSSGPMRIPMPPPPPPALKKEIEAPKRPTSRVDNGTSTASHRSAVPAAPVKKTASTVSSSLRDRAPPAKPLVNSSRPKPSTAMTNPTVATLSGASTSKASAAATKAKPMWGRSAPPPKPSAPQRAPSASSAKPVAPVSQRAPVKSTLTRKPSTRPIPGSKETAPTTKTSAKQPVVPEMVALPPSPPPLEEKEDVIIETEVDARGEGDNVGDDEHAIPEATIEQDSPVHLVLPDVIEPNQIEGDADESSSNQANEQSDMNTLSTILAIQSSSMNNKGNIPVPKIQHAIENPQEAVASREEDQTEDDSSLILPVVENPRTPQQGLKPAPSADANAGKTPISALLSSIERGFKYEYSPITPLSPADSYLPNINGETPYSHHAHAQHIKGPMLPFNHALHAPGHAGIFGGFGGVVKPKEELIRGDIGVVQLSEYDKIYKAASLPGLDDGRQAFIELNKN